MSASQIGGLSFISLRGLPEPMGDRLEDITRSGADGIAFSRDGKRPVPFTMTSTVDVTNSGLMTVMASYKAKQGTLVAVIDEQGNSHANVAVLNVRQVINFGITSAVGGIGGSSAKAILVCEWTLLYTEID